jgi:hypothetical protein
MSVEVKPGTRLQSAVCDTQVAVVKCEAPSVDLHCGGSPMIALDATRDAGATPAAGLDGGTQVGKRYVNSNESVEVLCTKPGAGTLTIGDDALELKSAKPLPSSD